MDVCLRCVSGHRLDESRGKIWYEYGKVGYATHIPALPKCGSIHKLILCLTLSIPTLQLLISFNVFVGDSASRDKIRLGRNCTNL